MISQFKRVFTEIPKKLKEHSEILRIVGGFWKYSEDV